MWEWSILGIFLENRWEIKKVKEKNDRERISRHFSCSESDKMIEEDKIIKEAKKSEENGIVFLDEIDKVSARSDRVGGDVSREGFKEIYFLLLKVQL